MATFAEDLPKGKWDVAFFAERFLGIRAHPGQKRMFRAYLKRRQNGYRALYLWLIVAAGNRAGKTLALAIIVLHACVYKMGQGPPTGVTEAAMKRWLELPFVWYHFGLEQENADIVFEELRAILEARHEAQRDEAGEPTGCPLVGELGLDNVLAQPIDKKYKGDYPWLKLSARLGGAEVHFRSVKQSALGSLGRDMHGVSFDEAGIVGSKLPFILNEVLHWRRLGTGGPFILISTSSEDIGPEFADLWYSGDPKSGDYRPGRYSMRMSTRENVGFGISQDDFDAMLDGMDESIIAQNIDGEFIQGPSAYFNAGAVRAIFKTWLPEVTAPQRRHAYVQGVDPALRLDSAWSIVLDVLLNKETGDVVCAGVRAERTRGKLTTPALVALAAMPHGAYDYGGSHCSTAIDATGFGGKLFKEALEEQIGAVRSIEFGGSIQKKRKLLGNLRSMIDEGRLFLPAYGIWLQVRRQLLGYKIDDRSIEQDAVMALAVAVAEALIAAGADDTSLPFDYRLTDSRPALAPGDGRRWARRPYAHAPGGSVR